MDNHHGHHTETTTMHHMHMNSTMDHEMSGHDMGDHDMNDHDMHSMMHMTFYFGVTNVYVLFNEWKINSGGEMAGACIAVCFVAMLYEGLKVLREILLKRATTYTKGTIGNGISLVERRPDNRQSFCSKSHWIQTFLHLVQVTISYALMLIFMTYNAYLAISIIVGAGLGYFIFGWKKSVIVDINEHCH